MNQLAHLSHAERGSKFYTVCPEEFRSTIDDTRLPDIPAFRAVANWNGAYPGPLGYGPTNTAKSRAIWVALKRLCISDGYTFTWTTTKQLTERYFKWHMEGEPERFWEYFKRCQLIAIDDVDKIELNERNSTVLFEFYDWAYRDHIPLAATTNRSREWWVNAAGEAFTRRMFDDAHHAVQFTKKKATSEPSDRGSF